MSKPEARAYPAAMISRSYPLSIVIPIYNEELVLPALFLELERVCDTILKPSGPVEIVLVNDGSKDKSWEMIAAQCSRRAGYVGVNLSRNFGHQLALDAGLQTARGDVVVSLDADLQDPPAVIVQMLEAHRQGYDVVYATRRARGEEKLSKRITAAVFYFLIEKLSGVAIPRNTGDFRLLSRRALTELSKLREAHRFLRGLVPWLGFPQTQIYYDRADRVAGETHYPFGKMLRLAFDGIASMSTKPLRLAYMFSLGLFMIFVGYIIYVLYEHFIRGGELVPGWTSIMAAITIFGTMQLLLLGVFGEYLGRIYEQAKQRPLFIIQEIKRNEAEPPKN
jgi:glycosyltransferase involved in cell wall biosynthesis